MHACARVRVSRNSGLFPRVALLRAGRSHASTMAVAGDVTTADSCPLEVVRVPMFQNNYGWILRDKATSKVAAVDPAEPDPVQKALQARGWNLDFIMNTHHHWDHIGGNDTLKAAYNCSIVGNKLDQSRIPGIDVLVKEGDTFALGETKFQVYDTPGHTRGHIVYWAPDAEALFAGDTLFAMGCGRLFEGTPEEMWGSLTKLKQMPPSTQVFCAHEYTENNAKWALTVEPGNKALQERAQQVKDMRARDIATVPSTLGIEFETNPFLRPDSSNVRETLGVAAGAPDVQAFAALRKSKDDF